MSILVNVEQIPAHAAATLCVMMSRVPCIDEYVFHDDQVFVVKSVWHPLKPGDKPMIRVVPT